MDAVLFVLLAITLVTGVALLVAPFFAATAASIVLRFLVLAAWVLIYYVAAWGIFAFNYCENNCSSSMSGPTYFILAGLQFVNGISYWVSYKVIGGRHEGLKQRQEKTSEA